MLTLALTNTGTAQPVVQRTARNDMSDCEFSSEWRGSVDEVGGVSNRFLGKRPPESADGQSVQWYFVGDDLEWSRGEWIVTWSANRHRASALAAWSSKLSYASHSSVALLISSIASVKEWSTCTAASSGTPAAVIHETGTDT